MRYSITITAKAPYYQFVWLREHSPGLMMMMMINFSWFSWLFTKLCGVDSAAWNYGCSVWSPWQWQALALTQILPAFLASCSLIGLCNNDQDIFFSLSFFFFHIVFTPLNWPILLQSCSHVFLRLFIFSGKWRFGNSKAQEKYCHGPEHHKF